MKRCYVLRHVPFESLGLLEPLLLARGFEILIVDAPLTALPKAALFDSELLIVLGGPISAYEEELYPFVVEELDVLERRLRHKKATLGICLGAQLIARALGARVYSGRAKEIGWSPLQLTVVGQAHPLAAVHGQSVLHWHGDTFDLPQGAKLLASTDVTPHQAFSFNDTAIALQFHLEVTVESLEAWYVGHAFELSRWGKMTVPELRALGRSFSPLLEPYAKLALGAMLDGLPCRSEM